MPNRHVWSVALVAAAVACAGPSIDDIGQYTTVPMSKVYPYPSQSARARIGARVTVHWKNADDVSPVPSAPARDLAEMRLGEYLAEVGATMAVTHDAERAPWDGSEFADADAPPTPPPVTEEKRPPGVAPGAPARDFVLKARLDTVDYAATFKPPTNWLFRSEEEMAEKPGTCTHRAEIEAVFEVFDVDASGEEEPSEVMRIRHDGEDKTETTDQSCPFGDDEKQALLSRVLDEALVCLRIPMENAFAPRGFISEERQRAADDIHLFKTNMGLQHGARKSLKMQVLRVQHSTGSDGQHRRVERPIAYGTMTDQIGPDHSWIRVDVTSASQEILEGDPVKATFHAAFTDDLDPFGGCSDIFSRE